jgi:hypothetical protein
MNYPPENFSYFANELFWGPPKINKYVPPQFRQVYNNQQVVCYRPVVYYPVQQRYYHPVVQVNYSPVHSPVHSPVYSPAQYVQPYQLFSVPEQVNNLPKPRFEPNLEPRFEPVPEPRFEPVPEHKTEQINSPRSDLSSGASPYSPRSEASENPVLEESFFSLGEDFELEKKPKKIKVYRRKK